MKLSQQLLEMKLLTKLHLILKDKYWRTLWKKTQICHYCDSAAFGNVCECNGRYVLLQQHSNAYLMYPSRIDFVAKLSRSLQNCQFLFATIHSKVFQLNARFPTTICIAWRLVHYSNICSAHLPTSPFLPLLENPTILAVIFLKSSWRVYVSLVFY